MRFRKDERQWSDADDRSEEGAAYLREPASPHRMVTAVVHMTTKTIMIYAVLTVLGVLTIIAGTSKVAYMQSNAIHLHGKVKQVEEELRTVHADRVLEWKDEHRCCKNRDDFIVRSQNLEEALALCQRSETTDHKERRSCKEKELVCRRELTKINADVEINKKAIVSLDQAIAQRTAELADIKTKLG